MESSERKLVRADEHLKALDKALKRIGARATVLDQAHARIVEPSPVGGTHQQEGGPAQQGWPSTSLSDDYDFVTTRFETMIAPPVMTSEITNGSAPEIV